MDVLIVEDERIISLAEANMVEKLGHRVLARVPSAEEALHDLETLRPDLVLMDIHLEGEMDGIEAGATIKKRWKIPLAYLSAYADAETRTRADATGPVDFLAKPIDVTALSRVFARVKSGLAGPVPDGISL